MPGVVVKGSAVKENSYVDSVASLFSDFFPQNSKTHPRTSNSQVSGDSHESVLWAHIVDKDEEELRKSTNELFSVVIGYSTGIQIWRVSEHGDAVEQLSIRSGASTIFRKIPKPTPNAASLDKYLTKRPLAAYTASQNGVKQSFKTLLYISLDSGELIHSLNFTSSIQDVVATREVIVVTFYDRLAVFDNATLEHKFSVTSCFPSLTNCVGVTSTWLAYGDRFLTPRLQSGGGVSGDGKQSYAASIVKSASYGLNAGLNLLSQYTSGSKPANLNGLAHQNGGGGSPSDTSEYSSPLSSASSSPLLSHSSSFSLSGKSGIGLKTLSGNEVNSALRSSGSTSCGVACVPGIVTVVDLTRVPKPSKKCKHVIVGTNNDYNGSGSNAAGTEEIVAHFPAYVGEVLVALEITNRGLIATAGESGRVFNVFKIHPHPWTSSQCAVHHLYALRRGETVAKISSISISPDLRWVSACSGKGTVHLFAINSYGGPASPRTHCDSKVVNKEDKFYCSAGLDDVRWAAVGGGYPSSSSGSGGMTPQVNGVSGTLVTQHHLSSSPSSPSFESHKLMSVGVSGGSSAGCPRSSSFRAVLNGTAIHPRIPPYPYPMHLDPVTQIKPPSTSAVPAACIPSGLNLSEFPVKSIFGDPCFNLDAFQLEFNSNHANDFPASLGNFDISPPDYRLDRSGSLGSQFGFSLFTFFGSVPSVLLETSIRVSRDPNNKDQIEVSHSPAAQWSLTRCTNWKEVKPGWSNVASSSSNEDSKSRLKAIATDERPPAYDTQASCDTLTGDLIQSDLSNSSSIQRTSAFNTSTANVSSSSSTAPLSSNKATSPRTTDTFGGFDRVSGSRKSSQAVNCNLETKCAQYNFWMAQVEMSTHASPHRRLWMGPQFTFKTIVDRSQVIVGNVPGMESTATSEQTNQPANLDLTHSLVNNHEMSTSSCVPREGAEVDSEKDCLSSISLTPAVPPFQSIDKFELDVLRLNGFVSPLVKSRQNIAHLRTTTVSPTTPNSSSCGASPPDGLQGSPAAAGGTAGVAMLGVQAKSKPVPIGSAVGSNKLNRGDRAKSDSGDSISSVGSAGSSYPFYIEVGSGDFERYRNMLNVANLPLPQPHNMAANHVTTNNTTNISGNPSSIPGRPHHRSRQASTGSIDDMSSWGEDANLDEALNSLESDSNQPTDDFHDAMDDVGDATVRTRSKTESQAFRSLPASSNQVRRRHNHKNRNQNDWRNFGPNVFYSRPAVGTPGQSNRKNSGGGNSGVGLGGGGGSNGSTDVFENACSIEGMLAEAMAEQSPPKLPSRSSGSSNATVRTRSKTESQAFSSLPASSNQVRRRHNHKNRNQNDWRNFGPNVFYSRPAVGTPGQSNRKNSGGGNSGVGLGGGGGSNGSTDVFENACSIEGMLAEAMAEQSPPKLPSRSSGSSNACGSFASGHVASEWSNKDVSSGGKQTIVIGGNSAVVATSPTASPCSCSSSPYATKIQGISPTDSRCHHGNVVVTGIGSDDSPGGASGGRLSGGTTSTSDDFVEPTVNDFSSCPMQQIPSDKP